MVNIEYISGQGTFKFNGETRVRNYHSQVSGDKVRIVNAYDTDDWLMQYRVYTEISVNGSVYTSAFELAEVLAPILFMKSGGTDGGSTSISGNIITKTVPVEVDWTQNATQQIVDFVNGQEFSVLGTQRILFKAVRIIGDIESSNAAEFHFWEFKPGKGSYGSGGTPITSADLEYISFVTNYQNNVVNLGEIGTAPIEVHINDNGPYGINTAALNVFKATREGVAANYIYVGTATSIGLGATQTTSADFIDVNATPVNPPSSTGGLDVPEEEGFVPVSQADGSLIWMPYSSGGGSETDTTTELLLIVTNWESGLKFNPYAEWKLNGVKVTDSRTLTADPADPTYGRYDLFIINLVTGQIEILKGTASENRTYPALTDPINQLDTGIFIDIPAGVTEPVGVSGEVVYAEGAPEEYPIDATASINEASTTTPHSGSVNIETTANVTSGQYIAFSAPEPLASEGRELTYWIKNKNGGSHHWIFSGITAKNGRPGSWTVGMPGNYDAASTAWQAQSVPFPAEIAEVSSFRLVSGSNTFQFHLDDIRIVSGGGVVIVQGVTREELEAAITPVQAEVDALEVRVTDLEQNDGGSGGGGTVVSLDEDNVITEGTDGGAYLHADRITSPPDLEQITAIHAASPLALPSYDGSTQGTHPSVIDFKDTPFGGFRYWMAYTPYPNSDTSFENPSILVSNDKVTWEVPAGLTNPIEPTPAQGYNSDPELFQGYDGKLYCYWRYFYGANHYIYGKSSVDGITWSSRFTVLHTVEGDGSGDAGVISPCIVKENGKYTLYCGTWQIQKRVSDDPLTFETATRIDSTFEGLPAEAEIWHYGITKVGNTTYCALTTRYNSNTDGDLMLGTFDPVKNHWTFYPLLYKQPGTWTSTAVYRASIVPSEVSEAGIIFDMWYGGVSSNTWQIGYTQVTTNFKNFALNHIGGDAAAVIQLTTDKHKKIILADSDLAQAVNLPLHDTENIPIGFETSVFWLNAGEVSITYEAGVEVLIDPSEQLIIAAQNNGVTIMKIGINKWLVIGALKKIA